MKNKLISIIISLFTLGTVMCCTTLAHDHGGYSHDSVRKTTHKDWMKGIDGTKPLSQISIPGTHDTMTDKITNVIAKTQSLSLGDQLDSGIRYLDIRCAYTDENDFDIYHGIVNLDHKFSEVIATVNSFLDSNPSEAIIMRLKQENTNVEASKMCDVLNKYVDKYPGLFWTYNGNGNPTLEEIRKKVVLLKDLEITEVKTFNKGVPFWGCDIEDNYQLSTIWGLYDKWENVKKQLDKSNSNPKSNTIYINHTGASLGKSPYFFVSGHTFPSTSGSRQWTGIVTWFSGNPYPDFPVMNGGFVYFEGTNILASDYIANNNLKHVGILVSDFPGPLLIDYTINCNF